MKNIIVQFDGNKYRLFQSNNQMELLGVAHSLDELKTMLSDQFSNPGPKVGDPYWYVYFGEDSGTVGHFEVRNDSLRKAQVDYYNRYHKLPLNVYFSQNQAVYVMQRVSAIFKDLLGKWEVQ